MEREGADVAVFVQRAQYRLARRACPGEEVPIAAGIPVPDMPDMLVKGKGSDLLKGKG